MWVDISIQGTPVAGNRDIPTVGIFRIVTGYGFQSNRGVFHRAGNRADLVHGPRTGHDPIAADPTPTGPQAARPHQAAGRRIEPPVSSHNDVAHRKAAVADPEPALDPPVNRSRSHGLRLGL